MTIHLSSFSRFMFVMAWLCSPKWQAAQEIDLLIKNGMVIDPANGVHSVRDITIANGKIVTIKADLKKIAAKKTIDAKGLIVCPGFIDVHTHVFVGSKPDVFADGIYSVSPDEFSFRAGVTTVVDAGTSGWRNFKQFKSQVIDKSKTRVLAWLNISGNGMSAINSETDSNDLDTGPIVDIVNTYKDIIVGIKIGHYQGKDWSPFDSAQIACQRIDKPLLVECHLPQYTLEQQLIRMRPGDIITHVYENISERMPIVNELRTVRPFVTQASQQGILFDVGHGGAGFWFNQAIPALKQGLKPTTFGTDLHRFSMNAGMKDMLNVLSKFMAMGMSLNEVISCATWNAAKALKRPDLGNLSIGRSADLVILSVRKGKFGYVDAAANKITGTKKLEAQLTIRDGKIVWDLNGLSATPFIK